MQTPTPDAVVDSQPETAQAGSNENDGANVVLVDDHPAVAKGIELLLRGFGHHVVGIADGPETAFRMILNRRPEVAVVDLGLPRENGARLTRRLLEQNGGLGVLLYTGGNDGTLLEEALDCGARGFAFKTGTPDELSEAVTTVAAGGTYMDRRLRAMVLARETTERIG